MWIVAKINTNQFSLFKESVTNLSPDVTEFYFPKIIFKNNNGYKTKNLLGNYIFCFNKHFNFQKIKSLKYLKGLNYFLENSFFNQKEINNFIKLCKSFEDRSGLLKTSFFLNFKSENFKFLNGPLKSIFFKILETNNTNIFAETNENKKVIIKKKNNIHFLGN